MLQITTPRHGAVLTHRNGRPEPDGLTIEVRGAARLLDAVQQWQPGQSAESLDMSGLAEADRLLIDQVLGEGEVGAQVVGEGGEIKVPGQQFEFLPRVFLRLSGITSGHRLPPCRCWVPDRGERTRRASLSPPRR